MTCLQLNSLKTDTHIHCTHALPTGCLTGGTEAGSHSRLIRLLYHSRLKDRVRPVTRVRKKKKKKDGTSDTLRRQPKGKSLVS